jgi:hypothetical protein
VDSSDVTRAIRRLVWPSLRDRGFASFTGRNAWRYPDENAVHVVNFQSFNLDVADAVGCTTFSFSVNVGLWFPAHAERQPKLDKQGRRRPEEYQCQFREQLRKNVEQPWFRPFSDPRAARQAEALRTDRVGLTKVFRNDVHDREEIWYVLPDGSNLDEVLDDALRAILDTGLPWLERVSGPASRLLRGAELARLGRREEAEQELTAVAEDPDAGDLPEWARRLLAQLDRMREV